MYLSNDFQYKKYIVPYLNPGIRGTENDKHLLLILVATELTEDEDWRKRTFKE